MRLPNLSKNNNLISYWNGPVLVTGDLKVKAERRRTSL
jgi:hypothetical protein